MLGLEPHIFSIVLLGFLVLAALVLLEALRQPSVVAYLIAGAIAGPYALGLVTDIALLETLGAIGVVFLMFFIGTEIAPRTLAKNWNTVFIGSLLQITLTVLVMLFMGHLFSWSFERALLLGFVITLSSTAVVVKLLERRNLKSRPVGTSIIGVLIMQDLMVIPMLLALSALGGASEVRLGTFAFQAAGLLFIGGVFFYLARHRTGVVTRLFEKAEQNRELGFFAALLLCFGAAAFTGLFNLSAGLGAFLAGMLVASARKAEVVRQELHAFETLFIAFFFISVGMLINLRGLLEIWQELLITVALIFILNTGIIALIWRLLGKSWYEGLFAGAFLAQIGEFSFFLALWGLEHGVINRTDHQFIIAVIALSMLLAPLWTRLFRFAELRFLESAR